MVRQGHGYFLVLGTRSAVVRIDRVLSYFFLIFYPRYSPRWLFFFADWQRLQEGDWWGIPSSQEWNVVLGRRRKYKKKCEFIKNGVIWKGKVTQCVSIVRCTSWLPTLPLVTTIFVHLRTLNCDSSKILDLNFLRLWEKFVLIDRVSRKRDRTTSLFVDLSSRYIRTRLTFDRQEQMAYFHKFICRPILLDVQ